VAYAQSHPMNFWWCSVLKNETGKIALYTLFPRTYLFIQKVLEGQGKCVLETIALLFSPYQASLGFGGVRSVLVIRLIAGLQFRHVIHTGGKCFRVCLYSSPTSFDDMIREGSSRPLARLDRQEERATTSYHVISACQYIHSSGILIYR
jgi:hypothetical protein